MEFVKISIRHTAEKGRGVFAEETIVADTVVEIAPVVVMNPNDRPHIDKTLLHDYIFEWQPEGMNLCCMALGNVPIYNHSYSSNCEYFMDYDTNTISIKAVRNIEAGTELTINYNGDWNDEMPLWFDVKE